MDRAFSNPFGLSEFREVSCGSSSLDDEDQTSPMAPAATVPNDPLLAAAIKRARERQRRKLTQPVNNTDVDQGWTSFDAAFRPGADQRLAAAAAAVPRRQSPALNNNPYNGDDGDPGASHTITQPKPRRKLLPSFRRQHSSVRLSIRPQMPLLDRRKRIMAAQHTLDRASAALLTQVGAICAIFLIVAFLSPIVGVPTLFAPLLLLAATLFATVHTQSFDTTLKSWPKLSTIFTLLLLVNDVFMAFAYSAVFAFPAMAALFMLVFLPGILMRAGQLPRWTDLFAGHFLVFILANGVWDGFLHRAFGALPWWAATVTGLLIWGYRLKFMRDPYETATIMMILLVAAYGTDFLIHDFAEDSPHPVYDSIKGLDLRWYGYLYVAFAVLVLAFRRYVFGLLIRVLSKKHSLIRCATIGALVAGRQPEDVDTYWTKAAAKFRIVKMSQMGSCDLLEQTDDDAVAEARYGLSWPCQLGACDIFVSQCQADSPALRWKALTALVRDFQEKHGREPTLFLHSFCEDPNDLDDAMYFLPLYAVLGCHKAAILWSANYGRDQRSILELFLLGFAGTPQTRARGLRARMELWPVSSSESATLTMRHFSVRKAMMEGKRDLLEEACVSCVDLWNGPTSFNKSMRALLVRLEEYYLDRATVKSYDFDETLERLSHVFGFGVGNLIAPTEVHPKDLEVLPAIMGRNRTGDTLVHAGRLHGHPVPGSTALVDLDVAVKVLHPNASTVTKAHYMTEAAILAQFNHGNVMRLFGVVTGRRQAMIITQLCAKGTLRNVLRGVLPDEVDFFRYARMCWGIAQGMEYLASFNVVHRGLTSENILVDEDDHPKIAGFGLTESLTPELASDTDGRDYRESELHLRLPLRWCAPEVLEHGRFSTKSDVWSFGIVSVEIFTSGGRPFGAWPDSRVVAQVSNGFKPAMPQYCPPEFFSTVIEPCFAFDADSRPDFSELSTRAQQSTGRAASMGLSRKFQRRESATGIDALLPRDRTSTNGSASYVDVSYVERMLSSQTDDADGDSIPGSPKSQRSTTSPPTVRRFTSPWARLPRQATVFREPAETARVLSRPGHGSTSTPSELDDESEDEDDPLQRASDPSASWLAASRSTTLGWTLGEFITGGESPGSTRRQDASMQVYEDESDEADDAYQSLI
eukprot:m.206555 g.206555  ORF g.206555 m.206555 type:complete len:1150 (-) comp23400_c0_seq1:123-3572(-)